MIPASIDAGTSALVSRYGSPRESVAELRDRHPRSSTAFTADDALHGEVVEAHVVTCPGTRPDAACVGTLQDLVKRDLSAHAYPRSVHVVPEPPKTPSRKIQRAALRVRRLDG